MSAVGSSGRRYGRLEAISLAFALVWSTVLVIAAFRLPAFHSLSSSGSHAAANGSATLVAAHGWGGAVAACVPLAAAVVTAWALWRRTGEEGAGAPAWIVTGLLVCFNALGMLTIGLFIVPATLALVVACANHGRTRLA